MIKIDRIYLIILVIITIINIITFIAMCVMTHKQLNKIPENKEEKDDTFDIDDYLISLEFNILLDKNITPLLGKMSNEEIVNVLSQSMIKQDKKISKIPENKLKNYIKETLTNYNNNYTIDKINTSNIDEEVYEVPKESKNKTTVDLKNTFVNFYNDDM